MIIHCRDKKKDHITNQDFRNIKINNRAIKIGFDIIIKS